MLVQTYVDMLSKKSVIRNLSEYAVARGKEIGYENVFLMARLILIRWQARML